jgi:hypothetical protein
MAEDVSRRLLTTEARFRSQTNTYEFCGAESSTATGFSPSTSLFPFQYHSTSAPYSSSTTRYFQQTKRRNQANNAKSNALFNIKEHRIEKNFHVIIITAKARV